jgi:signal transduction histidine kinase/DNA-binding response OmpR family regulator
MKKIFIVDDNRHLIMYVENKLRQAGHDVLTSLSGIQAVNALQDYTPDIIFIDYFLPNFNGDKLCRLIREMKHLEKTYLVVMSAAATELQLDLPELGANALIAKGTFRETAQCFFSAIADAELPPKETPRHGIMGADTVHPRQMTIELLQKNRHLQTMLDSIAEGIIEVYCGQIVYANPAAVAILDMPQEQLLAAYPPALFGEAERAKVETVLGAGSHESVTIHWKGPLQPEEKILSLKNLPFPGNPETMILLTSDITERVRTEKALQDYQNHLEALVQERTADLKRTTERLQQVEKMEAIGLLAGGVAHDLNNILAGLVGYPELLLLQIPEGSPLRKMVLTIEESGKRAAAVVQDLLTMARRGVVADEVLNLNTIISGYLQSPECESLKSFHPHVHIESDFEEELLNIAGSPVHLSKTVMNLVSNATEAMPDGGKIMISTQNRYVDRPISAYERIAEGDYVVLTVSDTGVGISSEEIKKIFDPFYTKKVMGRSGTGLGMSVVWATLKDCKGYIDVQSTVGKGTAFVLYFPVTRREMKKRRSAVPMEEYRGKGEALLIVDDVPEQLEIARLMLTTLGYSAATVSSGEEALDYLQQHAADLVVLDMVMEPGMDGLETYRRILAGHPLQKAILLSGYSETENITACLELGAGQYIKKPCTLERLGIAIRHELDRNREQVSL